MDYTLSLQRINAALSSNSNRTVILETRQTRAPTPSIGLLEIMLKDIINASTFDGLVELYLKDLRTGLVLHFTHSRIGEEEVPVNIAYSSWSTIKIPVLVSAFKRLSSPYDENVLTLMEQMVERSDNDSTDALAKAVIGSTFAPLDVTEDMQALGLTNTFWGGFFTLGSPLLQNFKTPANQRFDYNTEPDRYAQTTPQDLGLLLEDIYYCAADYGGSLPLAFNGEITQGMSDDGGIPRAEPHRRADPGRRACQRNCRAQTRLGVRVDDGYIHTIADAGIVYTPAGITYWQYSRIIRSRRYSTRSTYWSPTYPPRLTTISTCRINK
jgi:hypothetical protein